MLNNRGENLILMSVLLSAVGIYFLIDKGGRKNIEANVTPLDPIILPQHLQDKFRRMEDGELEDKSIDEVLEEYEHGGCNNGHGGKSRIW